MNEAIVVRDVTVPSRGDAVVEIDGRRLSLTSLDRVLWPEAGFTKADLVAYVLSMAGVILPHLRERPLTVGRFPAGVHGRGFAQTEIPGRPAWIRAERIVLANGSTKHFTIAEERAALVWLAQMGVIELHTFLARWPDLARPTAVVFDLDPTPPAGLLEAADMALALRDELAARGMKGVAKTSGSLGVHVLVPVTAASTYEETRAFATSVATALVEKRPDLASVQMPRAARVGRVLVDTRQNSQRLTMVAPYSLRAAPRPTVATPVAWAELERAASDRDEGSLVFEANAIARRVETMGDLMAELLVA